MLYNSVVQYMKDIWGDGFMNNDWVFLVPEALAEGY